MFKGEICLTLFIVVGATYKLFVKQQSHTSIDFMCVCVYVMCVCMLCVWCVYVCIVCVCALCVVCVCVVCVCMCVCVCEGLPSSDPEPDRLLCLLWCFSPRDGEEYFWSYNDLGVTANHSCADWMTSPFPYWGVAEIKESCSFQTFYPPEFSMDAYTRARTSCVYPSTLIAILSVIWTPILTVSDAAASFHVTVSLCNALSLWGVL